MGNNPFTCENPLFMCLAISHFFSLYGLVEMLLLDAKQERRNRLRKNEKEKHNKFIVFDRCLLFALLCNDTANEEKQKPKDSCGGNQKLKS